jgi:hypothetical protein
VSGTTPGEGQPGPYGPPYPPSPPAGYPPIQPTDPYQGSGYPGPYRPPQYPGQFGQPGYQPTPSYPPADPTATYAPIPGYPPTPPSAPPAYGGPPAPPPRKSGGTRIAIIVGAGVVALALIAGLVAFALRPKATAGNPPAQTSQPSGPATNPASQQPSSPAATADTAVRGFLQALAAGDAAAALSYALVPPGERTLLTSEVLAQSRRHGGLSAVAVTPVSDPAATAVQATYQVGRTRVSETFAVIKAGQAWKLTRPYTYLDLTGTAYTRQAVMVNGVPVRRPTVNVFPGTYVFSTGSRVTDFGSHNVVVVGRTSSPPNTAGIRPRLTGDGVGLMRSLARTSLDSCLRQHKLAPKNCPFAATAAGYKIDTSTIRWTRSGPDPFRRSTVTMDEALTASTRVNLTIKGSVHCSSSTFQGTCTVTIRRTAVARAPIGSGSPKVVWRSY